MISKHKSLLNKWKSYLKIVVSFLLILLILNKFDLHSIVEEARDVSIWLYLLVILGHFVLMAIKALRWKILLNSFRIKCSYREALKAYITGFAFGTFTPGQLGDMGKVMLIGAAGRQRKLALIPSFADRLWDLFGLILVSSVCVLFLFSKQFEFYTIVVFVFSSLTVAFVFAYWLYPMVRNQFLRRSEADIADLFKNWHWSMCLTAIALLIQLLRWLILSVALGVPALLGATSAMIGTLIALVPVSFGGLGTREAAMAALFSLNGLSPALGVSFSLLMFGSYLAGTFVGVILLHTYKIKFRDQSLEGN